MNMNMYFMQIASDTTAGGLTGLLGNVRFLHKGHNTHPLIMS